MSQNDCETKKFIYDQPVKIQKSFICYVPVFHCGCLFIFTLASLLICMMSSSLTSLSKLVSEKPAIFQVGIFLATVPGLITVWTYHLLIWSEFRKSKSSLVWICTSFLAGMVSNIILIIFAIFSNQQLEILELSQDQQKFMYLSGFMFTSLVYEGLSLFLVLEIKSIHLLEPQENWIAGKIFLVFMSFAGSSIQFSLGLFLSMHNDQEILNNVFEILNYSMFFLHILYAGTFYSDLKPVSITFKYIAKKEYERSLNYSTF
jgi:hypothetical protein